MSERKGTKALELWCKRLVRDCPDVQIDNMTTSWRNGMAFCALVHHFRPDLIDMSKLNPENIYENNKLAFSVAEKHLGIPALLDPEDMVENDVPDRLSVLTYLSQFYQRLGHTVNTKVSESDSKVSNTTSEPTEPSAQIKFGKTGLDKCTACGLPVYLAQRLMVSHKLYHRRCFRCSKCSGHINPKNYHITEGSDFNCDSCKNEKTLLKYLNNNEHDQMGMLAFNDITHDADINASKEPVMSSKQKLRPSSVLEKISMFERNTEENTSIDGKFMHLSLKDSTSTSCKEFSETNKIQSEPNSIAPLNITNPVETETLSQKNTQNNVYKSNQEKLNFLQTQLSGDSLDVNKTVPNVATDIVNNEEDRCSKNAIESSVDNKSDETYLCENDMKKDIETFKEDSNITDDTRISKIPTISLSNAEKDITGLLEDPSKPEELKLTVPPRRKKQNTSDKVNNLSAVNKQVVSNVQAKEYPDHLNPFSDDEEEQEQSLESTPSKVTTNPFGSSDEEDDEVPPIQPSPKIQGVDTSTPVKRLIAVNPFWSDGEEPSTDEEDEQSSVCGDNSKRTYSSLATSTPTLASGSGGRRRNKPRAPPPPPLAGETSRLHATSMDDVASISSLSSYNSTVHSDQKSYEKSTPRLKKRLALASDNLSTVSGSVCSLDQSADSSDVKHTPGSEGKRAKGPAPGLPLPQRREVKPQLSAAELQAQLDLLETQQLGLERQGVLIERMIRDKCEGDESTTVPQEEVEDLVIQLCELVNEKNDLFRKQTELMYIRRQQRLEQEQADIEHEIRIIQSRPAVNRIDADKAREEQLVSRLVQIVMARDELVQQLDAERRRERQEDYAIAASIANKRAQRNSDSNSSSMKSAEVSSTSTPKKNKVKDKMKKQFKKAKHTLISKKKDESAEQKEIKDEKSDKGRKSK